ncbi:MAG: hypothetical protein KC657_13565 [Myxococcales bacterium]|nr:hypothetical protein [Myxococcales bacterium]
MRPIAAALVCALALAACNKRSTSPVAAGASSGPAATPKDPVVRARMSEAWTRAADGDVEELAALAVVEGSAGLEEGAEADAAHRKVAIRAMAYARGHGGVRWLAGVLDKGSDEEASLAADALVTIASRPRVAEDAEDGDLLRQGCDALGALAKDGGRPRDRRVGALRALRMLADPGLGPPGARACVVPADVGGDLDVRGAR